MMKEKVELQNKLLADEYDMGLLIDYVKCDMMDNPYDQELMDGLNYFLNVRGLEIHSNDELNCMHLIQEEAEKFYEKNDLNELDGVARKIATKIISMTGLVGTIKNPDGTIEGNLNETSVPRETKQVTYAELDEMIGGSILCNAIADRCGEQLQLESGEIETTDEFGRPTGDSVDIYQWYIINESGADFLKRCTNQIVFYDDELDIYVWGITHYGTSWDYVYTTITV